MSKRTNKLWKTLIFGASLCVLAGCGESTLALSDGYPSDKELDELARQDGTGPGGAAAPVGNVTDGVPGVTEITEVSDGSISVSVLEPAPGTIVLKDEVKVEGTATDLEKVTINGQLVEVVEGRFEIKVPLAAEGPQNLTVQGGNLPEVKIPVVVDLSPPIITMTSPARGTFMVAGQTDAIQVKGSALDLGAGVTQVMVNGTPVQVQQGGAFSAQISPTIGMNTVVVVAEDGADRKSESIRSAVYGQYTPWGQPAYDAISGRILPSALDILEMALANSMATGGLLDGLVADNAGGLGGSGDFRLEYIRVGRLGLDLVPQNGYFDATIRLYDLRIGVEVEQTVLFFPVTIDGEIQSDPAELRTKLYLNLTPDGGITAEIRDSQVALRDFDIDIGGLLELFAELFETLVREFAEDTLMDVLNEAVLGQILDPAALNQTLDVFGKPMAMNIMLTELGIQPNGLAFAVDTALDMAPDPSVPEAPGVFTTRGTRPDDPNQTQQVRLSIADDFINGMLFQVWRGGGLNINITEALAGDGDAEGGGGGLGIDLNAGTFALLAGQGLLEHADAETPVGMRMKALLPPVTTLGSVEEGVLNIGIGDMILAFTLEPPGGPSTTWASMAVAMDIKVNIGTDPETGEVDFSIDLTAQADVIDEPLYDLNEAGLEGVVEALMGSLPDLLLAPADEEEVVEDPNAMGDAMGAISVRNLTVLPDGPGKDFLSLYLDLALDVSQ